MNVIFHRFGLLTKCHLLMTMYSIILQWKCWSERCTQAASYVDEDAVLQMTSEFQEIVKVV